MSWRPDDWNPVEILEQAKIKNALFSHRYCCEVGADAMAKALMEYIEDEAIILASSNETGILMIPLGSWKVLKKEVGL